MEFTYFSLGDLIKDNQIGKAQIQKVLSDFSCPKNTEVEDFLKKLAYGYEKAGKTKTFLIFKGEKFVAYYSVAMQSLDFSGVDKIIRRELFRTSLYLGNSIPAVLIGQLSKNYAVEDVDRLISGAELMEIIFEKVREISEVLSSVLVYVDCEDQKGLKQFYESQGFTRFENGDHDEYLCYVIPTKTILNSKRKK